MGSWELLIKQYELLRKEIIQCIYLRQLAVVGIYSAILTGVGLIASKGVAGLAGSAFSPASPAIPFIALGFTAIVNSFASLYLHEQHRNRRACLFNRSIERILTNAASRDTFFEEENASVSPFMGWENFLVSDACKTTNSYFYVARYLGIALPMLILGMPIFIGSLAFLGYSYTGITQATSLQDTLMGLGIFSSIALVLWYLYHAIRRSLKEESTKRKSEPLRWAFLLYAFLPAALILAFFCLSGYIGKTKNPTMFVTFLGFAVVIALLLACWSLYIFFHITKWLRNEATLDEEKKVTKWISKFCERAYSASPHQLLVGWEDYWNRREGT